MLVQHILFATVNHSCIFKLCVAKTSVTQCRMLKVRWSTKCSNNGVKFTFQLNLYKILCEQFTTTASSHVL